MKAAKHSLLGALVILALALVGGGCSVSADASAGPPAASQNLCTRDADCAGGACVDGACRARVNPFGRALLEVTLPANAVEAPGATFIVPDVSLAQAPGELILDPLKVARVSGQLKVEDGVTVGVGCDSFIDPASSDLLPPGSDRSLPVRVSLTPVEGLLGLTTQTYSTRTSRPPSGEATYEFSLAVPVGVYDVYLYPYKTNPENCAVPPITLRREFTRDTRLNLALNAPERLELVVRYAPTDCTPEACPTLDGWSVEVVDANTGRLLSSSAKLSDETSALVDGVHEYQAVLPVTRATRNDASLRQWLKFTPPDGRLAPIIYADRAGLELFEQGRVTLGLSFAQTGNVTVEGSVEGMNASGQAVTLQASVTFMATDLPPAQSGLVVGFLRTVETDDQGRFSVDLLPGSYSVHVVPRQDSNFAVTELEWSVAPVPPRQTGKIAQANPKVTIQGIVAGFDGERVRGLPVHIVPAATMRPDAVRRRLLGQELSAPQGGIASLDYNGAFAIVTDPGFYDISVRPSSESGFGWLVHPKLTVTQPGLDLERMRLPLPSRYFGRILSGSGQSIGGALVRAYLYVDQEGQYLVESAADASLVQVAESRATSDGTFELLVPVKLN